MKIILIGYMGCGKTAVGKKLAGELNLPFIDLDAEIISQEGIPIHDIFLTKGEIYFRKVENSLLKQILLRPAEFVLATGGGTPCYGDALDFILSRPNVASVYLKTPVQDLTNRLALDMDHRPLLNHLDSVKLLEDFIRKHLFERGYFYNQAKVIVENGNNTIDETVKKIIAKLF